MSKFNRIVSQRHLKFPCFMLFFFSHLFFYTSELRAQDESQRISLGQILAVDAVEGLDQVIRADGDIIYQAPGIVLYEGSYPSLGVIEADGGCIDENYSSSISKCVNFTIPADYDLTLGYPGFYGVVYHVNDGSSSEPCVLLPGTVLYGFDLQGNPIVDFQCMNPGETYSYCLDAAVPDHCQIARTCLVPFIIRCTRAEDLLEDYASKQGTPEAVYANQFSCLAAKSCKLFEEDPNSEIPNFVEYSFDWMDNHNEGSKSIDHECTTAGFSDFACFTFTGLKHTKTELVPSFMEYGKYMTSESDIQKWTDDHEHFLENAIEPCFDENPHLNFATRFAAKKSTLSKVRDLRNEAQNAARERLGLQRINPSERSAMNRRTTSPYYSDELAGENTIEINDQDFIIPVGGSINVNTADKQMSYELSVTDDIATISDAGILTIYGTYLPYQNSVAPIYVFARRGSLRAIGQYVITDIDTDDDGIVDSAETKFGLDPLVANDMNSDMDTDGLDDYLEVMIGTDPLVIDSDGDGVSDFTEYDNGTDALDGKVCGASVVSNVVVGTNATLNLKATEDVTLTSGFHAKKLSTFYAVIEGCD